MDTERNLLFGVVALQKKAVDADCLAETCADWVTEPTQPLADLFIKRGVITDEQKTEVEKVVASELKAHGGDPHATLVATIDGRSREAIRGVAGSIGVFDHKLNLPPEAQEGGHVVLSTLSPGEENRERYTLTHLHAKGGMGRVWLARDSSLGRQIALKELRPDQTDNSIVCSRFLYEAKITAQLEHPGIVPVYELGQRETPYYTMRFVRGHTLSEAIRAYHKKRAAGEGDSVGKVELLTAFVNVCHAIAYAHSRGIIHRDLKGQNVVLGDFGEVMVLDWGLAKRVGPDQQANDFAQQAVAVEAAPAIGAPDVVTSIATGATCDSVAKPDDGVTLPDSEDHCSGLAASPDPSSNGHSNGHANLSSNARASQRSNSSSDGSRPTIRESGAGPEGTMQGQLLGTPAYMAPEQAQGRHDLVDERTDVYGLGAILYEILTGRPPFIAPKTSEIIRKVCQEPPISPRQILPEIPQSLEVVCLKALRKLSAERYTTAAELAQEVQRYLADEPVQAFTEPWTTRVLRWARRHKTYVSTAAVLLVTATVALAASNVLVSNEKKEAERQGGQARHAVQMLTKVADIGFDDRLDPLQKEFLEEALTYYELFTSRVAHDPTVRLEHGRVYQQMGDIQRKLARLPESERAYQKAVEILQPLATSRAAGPDPKRALARTWTLLADLLVRHGRDTGQAEPLYGQALEVQQGLANAPAATKEDHLRLGQTLKSRGDLLRLNGQFTVAKSVYDEGIHVLGRALAAEAKHNEIRNDLALATDARGWIQRELGDVTAAEKDYGQALSLLDALVADFPTVPRYRESLAKACNSLALIEESSGRLADAKTHLRRELTLVERLSQDFPDRPEHRRELARTLTNLGIVLSAQNRSDSAEPILRRAIDVNTSITSADPDDVQFRLDLAKCHNNLGKLLNENGDAKQAAASFRQSQSISEALAKAYPNKPRYQDHLAQSLDNLALALKTVDPAKVEETYNSALAIYEKLVSDYPENVGYRMGHARCLRDVGPVLADSGRPEKAEAMYHKALSLLDTKDVTSHKDEWLRDQARVLTFLGALGRPGAEAALRRSIEISADLTARKPSFITDYHNLAIAQNNLGEFLLENKRLPEAGLMFAQSVVNFEKLVAESPRSIEYRGHFGHVLAQQGSSFEQSGKLLDARTALARAGEQMRQSLKLSKDLAQIRSSLGGYLVALANIDLKLGAYDEAARSALELPKTVPSASRGQACYDAARILARLINGVGSDVKLAQDKRDQLTRTYLGRTIVLLREAIDTDPKLAERLKADSDIQRLELHPDFRTIMSTLVNLRK